MAVPPWLAASAGPRALPGQINQFLGAHASTWIYSGNTLQASQATGSGLYVSSASTYLAQSFTTGAAQSTIGQVALQLSAVGGSPLTATIPPLAVSLYASAAGLPTGSALASVQVAEQYVYSGAFWLTVPLTATGLAPSTVYVLLVSPAGSGSAYYAWQRSNQTSGAATSPDGATWSAQAYGLMYQVYDTSGSSGQPLYLVDDGGLRVTALTYSGNQVAAITESTVAQDGSTFYSHRTLAYSGPFLTGVA